MAEFLSLAAAVEQTVRDGDTVAMEGFTHLIPCAAGHEVIRQRRKGLTLIRMTPDIVYDQMIGMGCAEKVVFSWGGNPGAVTSIHPGVTREQIAENTGWTVRYAESVAETAAPTAHELDVLRELHARNARAHGEAA